MSNNSKKLNKSVGFSRYDSIPWPRWSDNDSNSEQWNNTNGSFTHFDDDSQPVHLPPSLKPHSWKRPDDIKNFKPIIWSSSNNHPNLFINNQLLLTSEFMRWFISSVTILSYYGQKGLEVTESPDSSWNFRDKPWHGSLYIHCMNKAGLGAQHDLQINPRGRYIVRLFFMGCWRRIEINDLIPLNIGGQFLLPRTENNQELWPILLAKAMLKIAALSWTSHNEVNDFNPITCLTGWPCISLNITHLSPNDRWQLVSKYSRAWNSSGASEDQTAELEKANTSLKKQRKRSKTYKNDKHSGEKVRNKANSSVVMLISICNAKNNDDIGQHGIVPNYPAYVESSSEMSSNPRLIKPPLESWKLHRWLPWAMRHGIIDPADYFIPTRRIFLFNPRNVAFITGEKKSSSFWLDFNTLSDYPMNIHFFFKLEYFKCSIDVADVLPDELHEDKKEELENLSRISMKKLKERAPDDTKRIKKNYRYNHIGMQSRNEPLYLFIDSVHSKFLLFNFTTLPELDRNSSLIIERHCWFTRSLESVPLLEIKTMATTAKTLSLEPGRHLLRIFFHSKSSYHLSISSDTDFHVGDRKQMHELMQLESEEMKLLASKIQRSVSDLFNSFGTSSYRVNLKNYYRSYMPDRKDDGLGVRSYKLIHNHFRRELIESIVKTCDENVLTALKILFCDPEIRRDPGSIAKSDLIDGGPNPSMEDINQELIGEEENYHHSAMIVNSAITIQSFWRMARVKLYHRIHDVNHERHKPVQRVLLHTLFEVLDVNAVCILMKKVIKFDEKLSRLYPCSADFQKVLEVQEIRGTLTSISSHQWIPIVHLTVNVLVNSIVYACLDLFVDLPAYILQVFNNDTGCELQRIVNNVTPFHYERKKKGYTVIGYGWSNDKRVKGLTWSLHLTTIKGEAQLVFFNEDKPISSMIEFPSLQIHELSNVYVPNVYNLILKAILKISGGCWVALRVHASYEKVQMKLKVRKNDGRIITEVIGDSTIILPNVHLNVDDDNDDVWIVEAAALPESWPLTCEEWDVVMNLKQSRGFSLSGGKKLSTTTVEKLDKKQTSENFPQSPRWFLQVVSDDGTHLELFEDETRDHEIAEIKKTWRLNDPDRINRGNSIREKFLHSYSKESSHEQENSINKKIRTLKPPQQQKLSSFKLSKYYVDNGNENRRLKTESDEELDRIDREQVINTFEDAHESFIERSGNLLHDLQFNEALSSRIPTKRNT